jgi:ornithine--oxo-acid transaminase
MVWDVEGRAYIDMMSAYSAVSHGHLHPRLVAAGAPAAGTRGGHFARLSRHHAGAVPGETLPPDGLRAGVADEYRRRGGGNGDQVRAALGLSRQGHSDGQAEILVARGNFHGRTSTIVGFSSEADYREASAPSRPASCTSTSATWPACAPPPRGNTCAVIVEPIQGEAGVIVPPEGFFTELREWCSRNNIL